MRRLLSFHIIISFGSLSLCSRTSESITHLVINTGIANAREMYIETIVSANVAIMMRGSKQAQKESQFVRGGEGNSAQRVGEDYKQGRKEDQE